MRNVLNTKVAALALSVTLMSAPIAFAAQFTDISGHWAQGAIEALSQQGIINGYPSGQFKPQGLITRAEFASTIVKAKGLQTNSSSGTSAFNDVSTNFWAYPAIQAVSSAGLVTGYPDGSFHPNQNITLAEALAVIVKAGNIPLPTPAEGAQVLSHYSDATQVPTWAMPSVAAAIHTGLLNKFPDSQTISPNAPATRADVAEIVENLAQGPYANNLAINSATGYGTENSRNTNRDGYAESKTLQGHLSIVPASTVFTGVLTQPISSTTAQVGDAVTLTLDRPLLSSTGEIVIPQGSQVFGTISAINKAGLGEKNADIALDFNRVTTPDGQTYPLSAQVNTTNGLLVGGTTAGRVGRVAARTLGGAAIGGAAGAVIGRVTGGPHRLNEGLLYGALAGTAIGAGTSVAGHGKEVTLQSGETLELKLRQPLNVSP